MTSQWRPLFFTGGTALKLLGQHMAHTRTDSCHLVTTFDSGGSSAALRKAFAMPAVGDLRNRLLALADPGTPFPELKFFNQRIPAGSSPAKARDALLAISQPRAPIWEHLPPENAKIARAALLYFTSRMPASFDARGASIGNIIIAALYLRHKRDFGPALAIFSRLVQARGTVLPIVNESLHLSAKLANGSIITGQHLFRTLPSPVKKLFLTVHEPDGHIPNIACRPMVAPLAREYLAAATTICYPMGSFYSSLLATLLPRGIGDAIAKNPAAKIFIPNSGHDPETGSLTLPQQAGLILDTLRQNAPEAPHSRLLQYMLIDREHGIYPGGIYPGMEEELTGMGIRLVSRNIVCSENPGRHIPAATLQALEELGR